MAKEPMYKIEAVYYWHDSADAPTTYGPYSKKDADSMAEWLRYCGFINITVAEVPDTSNKEEVKPTKPATRQQIREALYGVADTVGRNAAGHLLLRRGFFYKYGHNSYDFAQKCLEALALIGVSGRCVDNYTVDKPFRGGATTRNSSHYFAEIAVQ